MAIQAKEAEVNDLSNNKSMFERQIDELEKMIGEQVGEQAEKASRMAQEKNQMQIDFEEAKTEYTNQI